MHRIDTLTAALNLFGVGKHGFRDGVPPGQSSTGLNAKWFNGVQEAICRAIEAAGIALVEGEHTQLTSAINALATAIAAAQQQRTCVLTTNDAPIDGGGVINFSMSTPNDGYTADSGGARCPTTGIYAAILNAAPDTSDGSDPAEVWLDLRVNGSVVGRFQSRRWSTNTGHNAPVSGVILFNYTNTAHVVDLINGRSAGTTVSFTDPAAWNHRLSIVRLRGATLL